MSVTIAGIRFDQHEYDERGDVLYLSVGDLREAPRTIAAPEGQAIDYDESGKRIGMVLVNVRWLLERDGELAITWPISHVSADDLAQALAPAAYEG